jgi:hypothetical protein
LAEIRVENRESIEWDSYPRKDLRQCIAAEISAAVEAEREFIRKAASAIDHLLRFARIYGKQREYFAGLLHELRARGERG